MKKRLAILALGWLGSISLHASGLKVYETDGPYYVQFGVLNNGANPGNPAPVGTSYRFGETTDFSGWIETASAEYEEVEEACEGDCVSVKFSKLPSYKASCKVYVVSATINVAYKDENNKTKTLPYNAVSSSEVETHEYGHADIAALGNGKGSGIWEGEVAGYQSSCQTDQSTCESECGNYLTAARTGAYITSGVRDEEVSRQGKHSYIYPSSADGRWKDSNPDWADGEMQGFEQMNFNFDASQTSSYPPQDGESCEDDEGGGGGNEL